MASRESDKGTSDSKKPTSHFENCHIGNYAGTVHGNSVQVIDFGYENTRRKPTPSIIFLDTEGLPIQEVSAIEVDIETRKIVDVYHQFARVDWTEDYYSRCYVHGLDTVFLANNGFRCEDHLLKDLKKWLQRKSFRYIYCNDARREGMLLEPYFVEDLPLPPWVTRIREPYHVIANMHKKLNIPIRDTSCVEGAHKSFQLLQRRDPSGTEKAKAEHGHHCALYDAYELYLYYCMLQLK